MQAIQTDFFLETENDLETKINYLQENVNQVRVSSDKVRRGIFARHDELAKLYLKHQEEIETLRSEIVYLKKLLKVKNEKTQRPDEKESDLFDV